jgi:hypothetical protein
MSDRWKIPEGSKITEAEARALTSGPYGIECARLTIRYCLPVFWFRPRDRYDAIINSGTVTLAKPSDKTIGITAAHVVRGFQADLHDHGSLGVQLGDTDISDLARRIIAVSDELDLATIDLSDGILERLGSGWDVFPLSLWPPKPPLEDHGITMGGFPASLRENPAPGQLAFGPWTVLSIARGVSEDQITWKFDTEYLASAPSNPDSPAARFELGGISGGPVLRVGESPGGLVGFRLAGIISQAKPEYEFVVAKRADFIREDGTIMRAPPR